MNKNTMHGGPVGEFAGYANGVEPLVTWYAGRMPQPGDKLYTRGAAPVVQALPEGWKPVPVEPTPEMIDATAYGERATFAKSAAYRDYKAMVAAAPAPAALPDGDVMMPKRLTAENGAKGALSGEFKEGIEVPCSECHEEDDDYECATCENFGRVTQDVVVGWDTIKDIYARAVEVLSAAPTVAAAQEQKPRDCSSDPASCPDNEGRGCHCTDNGILPHPVAPAEAKTVAEVVANAPVPSIDMPKFRALAEHWQVCLTTEESAAYAAMVSHIDAHVASQVQAAREQALEEAATICDEISVNKWDQYKGRGKHAPNNPNRADKYTEGEGDGADLCSDKIRALRSPQAAASTEKGAGNE